MRMVGIDHKSFKYYYQDECWAATVQNYTHLLKVFNMPRTQKYHIFNSDIRPCNTFIPWPPKN